MSTAVCSDTGGTDVLLVCDIGIDAIRALLRCYGLSCQLHADGEAIAGSFWGDSEAGVIGLSVHFRNDTPVHSVLHEASHIICMDPARRSSLHTNAGGDDLEEAAVCYLQILLADRLDGVGRDRLMTDMDRWGYSFRLGSTSAWFEEDAADAVAWLQAYDLIGPDRRPGRILRSS